MKIGDYTIIEIDETTRQIAESASDEGDKGDEVVLAHIEDYGWKWIATKDIIA